MQVQTEGCGEGREGATSLSEIGDGEYDLDAVLRLRRSLVLSAGGGVGRPCPPRGHRHATRHPHSFCAYSSSDVPILYRTEWRAKTLAQRLELQSSATGNLTTAGGLGKRIAERRAVRDTRGHLGPTSPGTPPTPGQSGPFRSMTSETLDRP